MSTESQLVETIRAYGSCAVAMSAGVDSTVVAKAAQLALGDRAVAVTGVGPALAEGELEASRQLAGLIGIRHEVVPTDEIHSPDYVANNHDRCFHCKTELYTHVERVARQLGLATIANGANVDDLGDYRPGMQAARDYQVRSPLVECGVNKQQVRQLAESWGLPVWDKPATPCLASRIAYGVTVTPERLRRIDLAEQAVRELGVVEVRVRCLPEEAARIEVGSNHLPLLESPEVFAKLQRRLLDLGFSSVEVDPEGYRGGRMNELLDPSTLTAWRS